ncbi:sensor histidine kinase [Propionicimonas sp.]|uniref:sensor histidine kinase n=1 Tax=Propionicimonas sp. TaxID=1955623 RepID=UPI0039E6C2FB
MRIALAFGAVGLGVAAISTAYAHQPVAQWLPDAAVGAAGIAVAVVTWRSSTARLALVVAAAWWLGTLWSPALYWHRGALTLLVLAAPRLWPRSRPAAGTVALVGVASLFGTPWQQDVAALLLAGLIATAAVGEAAVRQDRTWLVPAGLLVAAILGPTVASRLGVGRTEVIAAYDALVLATLAASGALVRVPSRADLADLAVDLGTTTGRDVASLLERLRAEPGLEPELRTAIEHAERLERANATARDEVQVAIAEVTASRRRLVTSAADERARLAAALTETATGPLRALTEDAARLGVAEGLVRAGGSLDAAIEGLRPAGLDDGVAAAVRRLPLVTALDAAVELTGGRASAAVEDTLYAVIAEALSNVAKHANATHVSVRYDVSDGRVSATVVDDGVGGAVTSAGTGLAGLADRVEALGGRLTIVSTQSGTTVSAEAPAAEDWTAAAPRPPSAAGRPAGHPTPAG